MLQQQRCADADAGRRRVAPTRSRGENAAAGVLRRSETVARRLSAARFAIKGVSQPIGQHRSPRGREARLNFFLFLLLQPAVMVMTLTGSLRLLLIAIVAFHSIKREQHSFATNSKRASNKSAKQTHITPPITTPSASMMRTSAPTARLNRAAASKPTFRAAGARKALSVRATTGAFLWLPGGGVSGIRSLSKLIRLPGPALRLDAPAK